MILSVPLPVHSQLRIATPEAPFLSLTISIGPAELSTLLLEMEDGVQASEPLQYVKTIRLHKARSLMLYEGLNAGEAAYRVGYHSASQFSREFRRLFGLPPTEGVARLQATDKPIDEDAAPALTR